MKCLVLTAALALTLVYSPPADAADEGKKKQFTVSPEVYERLLKAQKSLEKGKHAAALEEVDRIRKRMRLNPHEEALVLQTLGYIYAGQEKLAKAAQTLEDCHALDALPDATQNSMLYSIGQLHLAAKKFDRSIAAFEAWASVTPKPRADSLYTIAAAHFQAKSYVRSIHFAERAIRSTSRPKDSWLQLALSAYVETKRYRSATKVLTRLIERHPDRKTNWLQLAAFHAQLGDDARALAVLDVAHRAGLLKKSEEVVQLTQRLLAKNIPFAAGKILERAIADGTVAKNRQNTRLLATAWLQAREAGKAAPAMAMAAKLAADGELFVRLAQLHLEAERYKKAVQVGQKALAKGGLKNAGQVHLLVGIAHFRLGERERARRAFTKAAKFSASKGPARSWIKFLSTSSS